jgi:Ca-dependent carbohydrate-binding module xylan-binding
MSGSTSGNIIGSGSDSIVLNMAEEQALGIDAQFTVNVDGQQIGGVQTVTASQSAGQTEAFTFEGNYAPGQHDVTVSFANNFIYPGLSGDRNVYVDGLTYDGQTISNTTTGIYDTAWYPPNSTVGNVYGNAVYSVNDTTAIPAGAPSTPTTTPGAVSVGSGPDTLVLNMAEDPYDGNAQFTVSVDGQQIGGTQTTSAVVDDGQFQEFDVHGNFGSGTHTVAVSFLNDAVGGYYPNGTPDLPASSGQWALDTQDRNLYVMGASLDGGPAASGLPWEQSSDGTTTFSVTAGSNPSATATSSGLFATDGAAATSDNAAIPPGSLSVGTSTSSMSLVSSSATPTTASTASTTSDPPSTASTSTGSSGTSASTTTDPTPTVASAVSGTPQTTSDFTVPSTTSSSGSDPSSASTSTAGTWWETHQNSGSWAFHHAS